MTLDPKQLKQIIERFNSLQDEWEACRIPQSDLIQIQSVGEDSLYAQRIVSITDFLLHWNDHYVARVLWGDKKVNDFGWTRKDMLERKLRHCTEQPDIARLNKYDSALQYIKCETRIDWSPHCERWIFRSKSAFTSELEGGVGGLVEYVFNNLREEKE
jgi:hypothetical protein